MKEIEIENKAAGDETESGEYNNRKITPWYLLTLIKPILADELVAQLRFDRAGLRVKFCNGQKFRISIEEI